MFFDTSLLNFVTDINLLVIVRIITLYTNVIQLGLGDIMILSWSHDIIMKP